MPSVQAPTDHLIGRDKELNEICALLRSEGRRILTITGPPGVGKTRLAHEVAHALRFDYADGVYFIDLSSAADPSSALRTIAAALSLPLPEERALLPALMAHLCERHLLLVLDSCERLLAAAPALATLLADCPELTVLVTSRMALRIRAEQQYPLAPLALAVRSAQGVGQIAIWDFSATKRKPR